MSRRLLALAAAAAALTFGAPAPALAAAADDTAVLAATPSEAEVEAAAAAFEARMEAMGLEIEAIMSDASVAGADRADQVDALLLAYTPDIDAFADLVEAFVVGEAARMESAQEAAAVQGAGAAAAIAIRGIPDQVRAAVAQALAEEAATAAAAAAQ